MIQTSDFSFPSEDYTGQINDIVARKTREMLTLHKEMLIGREPMEVEEVKIEEEAGQGGRKRRRKRNLEKYAPLIFEECYVKQRSVGHVKVQNSFELQAMNAKPGLSELVNPTKAVAKYRGVHLFVLCHGFQGSSFDMRTFKNVISLALPEALFLCSQANEEAGATEGNIYDMGYKLSEEVNSYIRESCPGNNLARLTFIGHSLGGLIIRAALPILKSTKTKCTVTLRCVHPILATCTRVVSFFRLACGS